MVETNKLIVSCKDRVEVLNRIADKLGCPSESVGRVYDINTRTLSVGQKDQHVANGLYLWVNRSGSLREITETNMLWFPRFARYLVLNDRRDDKTILLYNADIRLNPNLKYHLSTEVELSIPVPDVFEAMRFINRDIVGEMFEEEFSRLLG